MSAEMKYIKLLKPSIKIPSCQLLAEVFLSGQGNGMQMNPSLAIYRGLKRAGIDFAASVPCVNLQELLDLVGKYRSVQFMSVE